MGLPRRCARLALNDGELGGALLKAALLTDRDEASVEADAQQAFVSLNKRREGQSAAALRCGAQ